MGNFWIRIQLKKVEVFQSYKDVEELKGDTNVAQLVLRAWKK